MDSSLVKRPLSLFFVVLMTALLIAYAYFDVTTSAQAGNMDMARNRVYPIILSILVLLGFYAASHKMRPVLRLPLTPVLVIILIWLILGNVLNGTLGREAGINVMMGIMWILSYFSFFQYIRCNKTDELKVFFIVMFVVYLVVNVYAQRNIAIAYGREYGMTSYSYYLLSMLPALMMVENKGLRLALVCICSFFVVFSFKRGPILTLPLILLVYILIGKKVGTAHYNLLWVFVIALFTVALVYYVNLLSNGFLLSRFSEDELSSASGRDEIWSSVWADIRQRDYLHWLIGKGAGYSVQLVGTGVHNEWLEFLSTYGLIGVAFYFSFFIALIRRLIGLIKDRSRYAPQYAASVAFFFLSGLSDGFYFVYWSFYFFSTLGYIEALVRKEKKQLLKKAHLPPPNRKNWYKYLHR